MMSLENSIENLNSKSIDNFIPTHYTYLNWAVKEKNLRVIDKLLKKGINPNGITSIGLSKNIPLTVIDFRDSEFQTIVRMLLKHGANINGEDLEGHTILTKCVFFFLREGRYNVYFFDLFTFLLQRGANSDGTIFYNPLQMIVESIQNIDRDERDILFYLTELLLAYNANPKSNTIIFNQFSDNIKSNAVSSLEKYKKNTAEFKLFNKLFNITITEVVSDCKSDIILQSLSKYYKIQYDGSEKGKKELCKCIETVYKNREQYDEDEFISLRAKIRKIKGTMECSNEDLLIGSSIDSFPESELIYLDEKNPNIRHCFHVSEIPMLLSSQKNPFNNKPLPEDFLNKLLGEYKYFVPKTLDEAIGELFIFKETKLDSGVLLEKLSDYVKSFNTYMQPEKIKDISIKDLVEIQNMIYGGNIDLINSYTLPSDRVPNRRENIDIAKSRILDRTITHIFMYIRNNQRTLPLISNIIDQLLRDTFAARDIISLFPLEEMFNIKTFIKNAETYDVFKINLYTYIIKSNRYMDLILKDKKFINSLDDNEREKIFKIDKINIQSLYTKYIFSNIEVILKERFGDISINAAWNDIVPSILRN